MVVSGDLSSISGSFCISTSRRQCLDLGSIWNRFGVDLGSWEGLGRVLGSFGVPFGAQDRILIDFRSVLEPLLGPSRPQLGGLGASFGVLGRSAGGLEPFYIALCSFVDGLTRHVVNIEQKQKKGASESTDGVGLVACARGCRESS